MTEDIRIKIKEKNKIYSNLRKGNNGQHDFLKLQTLISEVSELIIQKKDEYYDRLAKK